MGNAARVGIMKRHSERGAAARAYRRTTRRHRSSRSHRRRTSAARPPVAVLRSWSTPFARITAYEQAGPKHNALIRINPKARAEAAQRDAERVRGTVRGSLHGIPVIIKDNFDTGDMPTSGGSLALANSQPAKDAFVVKKLRDAGAIILAKSNLHELAAGITSISSLGGQTRNPYDPARCPGGQAAAPAPRSPRVLPPWAGARHRGSIRIPSAFGNVWPASHKA
jgi:Asp-tRNA(Asn)/Glu-tRNA(Gln) amidotransferase A subunit family amidase